MGKVQYEQKWVLERVQMCEKECVAIAKIEISGRCNHVGVEKTRALEWAETMKRSENVIEEGPM
jgi:hypothetical protein